MSKNNTLAAILALIVLLIVSGCADTSDLEEALLVAQREAAALATQNADLQNSSAKDAAAAATESANESNASSTRAAGALAEAQGAAEEAIAAAEATSEAIGAAATAAAFPDIDYDTNLYGVIDELDLNGIVVTWWHNNSGRQFDAVQTIIDEFNNTNPYGIVVDGTNEGDLGVVFEKMQVGLNTGDVPSLVSATPGQIADYQARTGIVGLDPYFEHPTFGLSVAEQADFHRGVIDSTRFPQFENQLLGFPQDRAMELLYYNADLLAELGFVEPPRNIREFEEMACEAAAFSAETTGFQIVPNGASVMSYAIASGDEVYDPVRNAMDVSQAGLISYLEAIERMFDEECVVVSQELFSDQTAFGQGNTLFIQGSSLNLPFIQAAVEDNVPEDGEPFNWSIAPIPYIGFEPIQNTYGVNFAIPKTTAEEQLSAWIFIQYFASIEQQAQWVRTTNNYPLRLSTSTLLESYFQENPIYQEGFVLLKYSANEPAVRNYDSIQEEVTRSYASMFVLDDEIPTIFSNLNGQINSLLTRQ
ncbi:MAG: extracellular solute-binding protein [Chloroflexota bacterium]